MKVAFLSNTHNAWLRQVGKDILTSTYLLLTKGEFRSSFILPEYDYLAALLDPHALKLSIFEQFDVAVLKKYDLLIWEWGWGAECPNQIIRIRKSSDIPILTFPGPIDRFWREVDKNTVALHIEASRLTNNVGVMLEDTVEFFEQLLPHANVFHLPVPMDVALFKRYAKSREERDPRAALLTAPTNFYGSSSQIPITTYLAFRNLVSSFSDLKGICFSYSETEQSDALKALDDLGLGQHVEVHPYYRPVMRFLEIISKASFGLSLPHSLIQGRMAMMCACLGIPMVVSNEIETHCRLFPHTAVPWTNPKKAAALAERLIRDRDFSDRVSAEAAKAVEFYGIEESRNRIMTGIGKK